MTSAESDDRRLLERVGRGDREAFEALVDRHQDALFRVARRLVGAEAEDALQDAFLAVWRNAGSWRGEATVRTWLFQIAINACHRRARQSPPQSDADGTDALEHAAAPIPAPDAVASAREIARALETALGTLEPDAREVLVLRDVEGLSGEDVAEILGLGLAAMKSRLHRARLTLKERVEALLGRPVTEELS